MAAGLTESRIAHIEHRIHPASIITKYPERTGNRVDLRDWRADAASGSGTDG